MAAHSEQPLLSRFTPLVLLKYGTGDPLFIVHGLGGAVAELAPLGRLMPSLRPVYAIQARGVDGDEPPFDSLVDMANYYLDNLKDVQPRGPYLLAGYSFGGVVAFEMAQQLAKAGEKVALLAMLDSYTHPRSWPLDSRIGVLWRRIANQASIAATVPARQTVAYIARRLGDVGRNLRRHGPSRSTPVCRSRFDGSSNAANRPGPAISPSSIPARSRFSRREPACAILRIRAGSGASWLGISKCTRCRASIWSWWGCMPNGSPAGCPSVSRARSGRTG